MPLVTGALHRTLTLLLPRNLPLCVQPACDYWLVQEVSPNKPGIVERRYVSESFWGHFLAHDTR